MTLSVSPPAHWILPDALARISTLQGHYVAAHLFRSPDSPEVADMLHDAKHIKQAWLHAHPEGEVISVQTVSPETFDLHFFGLGLDHETGKLSVCRGLNAKNRELTIESGPNQEPEIQSLDVFLSKYSLFQLSCYTRQDDHSAKETNVTATDWFINGLGKKRPQISDGIIATFIMNLLAVATAMYSMQVYDRVIPSQSNSTLIVLTVGVLLSIFFEYTMRIMRAKLVDETFKKVDIDLSSIFFHKALSIKLDARPKNTGTFISELRSFETVRSFMTSATLFVLADAPFAIIFAIIIMFIGGVLGLIPLFFIVVMLTVGFIQSHKLRHVNEKLITEAHRKNALLIEAMDGIESIKAANAESQVLHNWKSTNLAQSERELFSRNISTTANSLASSIQQVAYISTVAIGSFLIHSNSLTVGGLIACTILGGRVLAPLTQIPNLVIQWSQIKISLKSLDEIMQLPSDADGTEGKIIPEKSSAQISLDGTEFEYEENRTCLAIPKMEFKPGEVVVIMGKVGSGKSTLIKLLSGLYSPTRGRILLDHVDLTHLSTGYVREKIGYLPQDVRLIRGTLKDNLTLGLPFATDSEILAASEKSGLDRLIKNHPAGLNLMISDGGLGLSGGQKQMVALTRLFLAQPLITLFDEPTASLDGELEAHILNQLKSLIRPDGLMIVVSHKPSILQLATRMVIVDNGKVVEDGPRDAVLSRIKEKAEKIRAMSTATSPSTT
jgi:ATP-binding cassette subfamily C protein LapB